MSAPFVSLHGVNPTYGQAGVLVTVSGTSFLTPAVSAVRFGAVAGTSLNVINNSTLTVVVPAGARGSTLTVVNADGETSHAFTVLLPGPWIQPGDAVQLVNNGTNVSYVDAENASSQPDPGGTGAGSGGGSHGGGFLLAAGYRVGEHTDFSGAFVDWSWVLEVWAGIVDLAPIVDGGGLNPVPPSGPELAAPHVFDFEYEHPAGVATGPVAVHIGATNLGGDFRDETDGKTADPAESDIFASRFQVARLGVGDYSYDALTGLFLSPDAFPLRALLAGLVPVLDVPIARDSGDMTVDTFVVGSDNEVQSAYTAPAVEIDTTLTDLDATRQFAVIAWIDRMATGTEVTLPTPDPVTYFPPFPPEWDADASIHPPGGALRIGVAYTPPRYRLLYDVLPVPAAVLTAPIATARPLAKLTPSLHIPQLAAP